MPTYTHQNYVLYDISGTTYTPQIGASMVLLDVEMTELGGATGSVHEDGELFSDNAALAGDFEWNGTFTDGDGDIFHVYIATADPTIALVASDTVADPGGGFPFPITEYPATFEEGDLAKDNRAFCFGPDTDIATASGSVKVQDLAIGDSILTTDGGEVAVLWVGRQKVIGGFAHRPELEPVRIKAGALGDGLPRADLMVSSDHGMVMDGLLINASALVNGTTIAFVPVADLPEGFTYYHIETKNHDIVIANGAASETFVDVPGRAAFDNYKEYIELYGVERIVPEMAMPRITSQRLLPEPLRARLGVTETPFAFDTALKSA